MDYSNLFPYPLLLTIYCILPAFIGHIKLAVHKVHKITEDTAKKIKQLDSQKSYFFRFSSIVIIVRDKKITRAKMIVNLRVFDFHKNEIRIMHLEFSEIPYFVYIEAV
jgi:hypothetical protein